MSKEPEEELRNEMGEYTELKIVMDVYGLLYAVLPDGSKREIYADIFRESYKANLRIGEEVDEEGTCWKEN